MQLRPVSILETVMESGLTGTISIPEPAAVLGMGLSESLETRQKQSGTNG
jgi:hypothetical protein